MKIAVFGGTGFVGRFIVEAALEREMPVRVLARDPAKLGTTGARVEVVEGDYFCAEDVAATLRGVDAVVSTIGPMPGRRSVYRPEDYERGMVQLVAGMRAAGVRRIVNIAGSGTSYPGEEIDFSRAILRFALTMTGPVVTPSKERELAVLMASELDYTTIRPPIVRASVPGRFVTDEVRTQGLRVDAGQLAGFMLDILDRPEWFGKKPFVGTKPAPR